MRGVRPSCTAHQTHQRTVYLVLDDFLEPLSFFLDDFLAGASSSSSSSSSSPAAAALPPFP